MDATELWDVEDPTFLENRLTYGAENIILKRRKSFNPRKIPNTHLF
jgi:hypothetical protein